MSAEKMDLSGHATDGTPRATSSMVFRTGRLVPSCGYERAIRFRTPKEHSMLKVLAFLRHDDRGVTAVEYGLLLVLLVGVIAAGVGLLGTNLNTFFTNFAGHF
jgi:Flp pilus assembly pilin Flp